MNNAVIDVRNLSVIFPDDNGGLHTLEDVSFLIEERHFICILGPSGCGKTTLLRALAGFIPPTTGSIYHHDRLIEGPCREVGFVFQDPNLMPWRTVRQNILLPLELRRMSNDTALQKADEMIDLVGLRGFETYYPRDLSGGMAQRVALARVLIYEPDILLLDEPFSALDAITRQRMCGELLNIWQEKRKTMIMVTHSISDAVFLADKVLVMSPRPGKILAQIDINLPRPRQDDIRYSVEFSVLARQIRDLIQ